MLNSTQSTPDLGEDSWAWVHTKINRRCPPNGPVLSRQEQKRLRMVEPGCVLFEPVAPVAYQVFLESGIGQSREFDPPPSAYSYKFVGTYSCAQIDFRKARERELATLDETSTSSGIC